MDTRKLKTDLSEFRRLHAYSTTRLENAVATLIESENPRKQKRARLALTRSLASLESAKEQLGHILAEHAMLDFSDLGEGPMEEPGITASRTAMAA